MLTKNINFKNFLIKSNNHRIKKIYIDLKNDYLLGKSDLLKSLSTNYEYSYDNKKLKKYKKYFNFRIIGIGGSILGSKAIYSFLKKKIKKKFFFISNLNPIIRTNKKDNSSLNIIISKSGNTLETICNSNIYLKKKEKNIFITKNTNNYLRNLANKLKAEVIDHNNFIGGRYSVLSEVGMLPAQLMGLNSKKFKRLNILIKNKNFINQLINNVGSTINLIKKNKINSIILNYDEQSENFFQWYQQLIAESLGKKSKGILPIISTMPKDNHSLMQYYLDGPKNNFYTFFSVLEKNSNYINKHGLSKSHYYLKNKSLNNIIYFQKKATENIFIKKKIPFRSFEVLNRNEETMGEMFCFFILETILLGKALKVNPYDQPSVELIKVETKKNILKG